MMHSKTKVVLTKEAPLPEWTGVLPEKCNNDYLVFI